MYICLNDIQWILLHIEEEFCSDYIIRVYENDMLAQLFNNNGVTTTVPVSKVSIHTYIYVYGLALYVYVCIYIPIGDVYATSQIHNHVHVRSDIRGCR